MIEHSTSILSVGDIRWLNPILHLDCSPLLVVIASINNQAEYLSLGTDEIITQPQAEIVQFSPVVTAAEIDPLPLDMHMPGWRVLSERELAGRGWASNNPYYALPQQFSEERIGAVRAEDVPYWHRDVSDAEGVRWMGDRDPRRELLTSLHEAAHTLSAYAMHVSFSDLDGEPHHPECPCSQCTEPSGRVVVETT